ncbi:MAG: hypothetical protein ACXW2U_05305 [Telluria sp.]
MSRPKNVKAPIAIEEIVAAVRRARISYFEKTYAQFDDNIVLDAAGSGQLTRDLNRIFSICSGLGVVARFIVGNDVVTDFHDPEDPDSQPPLSRSAINAMTTMIAATCEWICDDISLTADDLNDRGPA